MACPFVGRGLDARFSRELVLMRWYRYRNQVILLSTLRNITASCKPSPVQSVRGRNEWVPDIMGTNDPQLCPRDRHDAVYSHHIDNTFESPATRTMTGTPSTSTLDHIVFLSPPGTLPETRKKFTEYGFE